MKEPQPNRDRRRFRPMVGPKLFSNLGAKAVSKALERERAPDCE